MKDDREVQGKNWKIKWTNISALLITRLEKNAANDKHAKTCSHDRRGKTSFWENAIVDKRGKDAKANDTSG